MATVLYWLCFSIGALVLLVIIASLVFLSLERLRRWWLNPHAPSVDHGFKLSQERLIGDSWWFSESPATMQLLRDLASGVNVSVARDTWRKSRVLPAEAIANESIKGR